MESKQAAALSKAKQKTKHIAYFDVLRVVAILGVVVLHASATGWNREELHSSDWQLLNFFDGLAHYCVPVFFMISGALFLDPGKHVTVKSIYARSMPRIIIPFLFWSVVYAVFLTITGVGNGSKRLFLERVILGHFHLWFLIALAGLYVATPILRRVVSNRGIAWYFMSVALIFTSIVPLLEALPLVGPLIEKNVQVAQVQIVLGYTMYFVLGYLLHTTNFSQRAFRWILVSGLIGVVVTVAGTSLLSLSVGSKWGLFYSYLSPNVLATSAAVFLAAKYFVSREPRKQRGCPPAPRDLPKLVVAVSQASFGIYLVHHLFQMIFRNLGFTDEIANPLISVPLLALAVLVPSFLVAVLIRKIPKVGRYLA